MNDLWMVARHEYRQRAGKRGFLLATLGVPVMIIVVMGIAIAVALGSAPDEPVGYVDHAGILSADVQGDVPGEESSVEFIAYADAEAARAALEAGEIQAFYVLEPDYLQTRRAEMYYWTDPPSSSVRDDFGALIQVSIVKDLPPATQARLIEGPNVAVRSADGARTISGDDWVNLVVPFVAAFLFIFAVIGSAGYLLQVITDEKENRTMEILVTSITPTQLMGGKAVGLMGVMLTQMAIWLAVIVGVLVVGAQFLEPLRNVRMPWDSLAIVLLFFLPAYALVAGLMTAIGSAVTEVRQGQQIAGILNLLFMFPVFLSALVFTAPNSPIWVAMTLFPPTAFAAVTLRWGITTIPIWQLVVSWLLLVGSAGLSIWVAARVFRAGMLRYGQPLSLRGALAALGWE